MFRNKNTHKRLAMVLGGIIGAISIGTIITIATLDTNQEIPDSEVGTIGYALRQIIDGDWQNSSLVKQSQQLGGVNGEQFLRITSTYGCTANNVLRRISPDGNQSSGDCVSLPAKRSRPILATIRDLDSSCAGAVSITNTGTYIDEYGNPRAQRNPQTYTLNSSDPIDLYEDDTIETTAGCSLASLYMPDNSIIRLSASTKITLRYAGIPGGSGATSTDLDGGEMWARVLKPITDDSYFNINTQEASVGVRGTSVWIQRDMANSKTIALPIDSGKLSPTDIANNSGAIIVYPKHGDLTALGTPVPLTHTITVDTDGKSLVAPYSTSTTAQIYSDKPFVRRATLADIKDFKALQQNVGNLATIRTTQSEFNTRGGDDMKWRLSDVVASADQIGISSTLTQEIAQTLPNDDNEKGTLCGNSSKWWDAVPLGQTNCIDIGTGFLADYSKNDSNLYGSGLTSGRANIGSSVINNGGIAIINNGEYIKYNADRTKIPNSTITIQLTTDVGNDGYVFDFGGNIKLRQQGGIWKCMWNTGSVCPGSIYNTVEKRIIVTLPAKASNTQYTQLIFGNTPAFGNQNPIGTTIQSISISPPMPGGS